MMIALPWGPDSEPVGFSKGPLEVWIGVGDGLSLKGGGAVLGGGFDAERKCLDHGSIESTTNSDAWQDAKVEAEILPAGVPVDSQGGDKVEADPGEGGPDVDGVRSG